jgi:protein-S-isoprenylcysteine O-methyltransferase Ste14
MKDKLTDFFYKIATGSKKVRTLLTPVGATFFVLFIALLFFLAVQTDKVLKFPKLISSPFNIILSLPILSLGLFVTGWSVFNFLQVKGTPVPFNPPPKIVATGPYGYVRNPMLTGVFMLLFGLGIFIRSFSLVLIFTPLFIAINIWELKAIEEPELAKRLGEEYLAYKKKTPMFIPNFRIKLGK